MMRRKRLVGLPQAYYTSGHSMPTPFASSHYYNRFINSKKLAECQYCYIPPKMSLSDFEKKHKLPARDKIQIVGNIRPMVKKDVSTVHKLLQDQVEKCKIKYKMSHEDIMHHLLP
jgi:hypothetical protein